MENEMTKEVAHRIVDTMPDHSTWDGLIHEIYIRQVIKKGLADSEAGRTMDISDVRGKFGMTDSNSAAHGKG
ncbi:MAG: hypothetical protein KC931_26070 [Candidatus Omnitrophica bacterium]|nr:hypothetical protein [Candidatus Omnitrophota bacterium]